MNSSFIDSKVMTLAPSYKNLSLLGIIGLTISITLLVTLILHDPRLDRNKFKNDKVIYYHRHCSPGTYNASTICTNGCRIPLLAEDKNNFEKSWTQEYADVIKMQSCKSNPLIGTNKTHIWIEKQNMHHYNLNSSSNFTCCYRSFNRRNPSHKVGFSNRYIKYSNCTEFKDTIPVNDEYARVTCTETTTLFDSYFVFAQEKEPTFRAKKNIPYNVMILGIDGVSRLNFHRTMPNTVESLKKLGAVELYGYNKVADNTFPNLIPLLSGITEEDLNKYYLAGKWQYYDHCPFIWKQFRRAGFLTAFAEDVASFGTFNFKRAGFKGAPTDYYLNPFISETENNAANYKNDYIMLCMNEKFFFQLLLDYVEDLTTLKNKLFGFFWEVTMTHNNLFFPMAMDDSYTEFFGRLNASGYLNNSIILLVSDHGIRFGAFRETKQGFLEERLPLAFALMPPSFRDNYDVAYNNLKLNSRHLTTPFDLHATLADLVDLENINNDKILARSRTENLNRGISLFLPISEQRTCKSAGIDDHWCTCYRNVKLLLDNRNGKEAITHTISYLNSILEKHPQCSALSHASTLEVTQLLSESLEKGSMELVVKFNTMPGGGVFEATVARDSTVGLWAISGSVSRLNVYGNQSHCVTDVRVAMYCYCFNSSIDSQLY